MSLSEFRVRPATGNGADKAEEVKQVGAHVIAQAKALRADFVNRSVHLQAATDAARQAMAYADAQAAEHERQRDLLAQGWDHAVSVLEQIQQEREALEQAIVKRQVAEAAAHDFPGAVPGAVPSVPFFYPAGQTHFNFLYQALANTDAVANAALPLAGGTLTGFVRINNAPAYDLSMDGRYAWSTDNTGSPPHTVTGPNLYLTDQIANQVRAKFNSLGEVAFFISDPSLVTNGVSHCLQLWGISGGGVGVGGFGTGVQIFLSDAAGVGQEAGNLQCWLTSNTAGAISTAIALVNRVAGAGQVTLYGDPSGELRANAPAGYYSVPRQASTASRPNFSSGVAGFNGAAGGTHFGANQADFTNVFLDFQVGGVSVYKITGPGQIISTFLDAVNNAPSFALRLGHQLSSGVPAAGFGAGLQVYGGDSTGAAVQIGSQRWIQSNATPGSVTSDWVLQTMQSGVLQDVAQTNDLLDFKGLHKVLAVSGLGAGNAVTKTTLATPGTVLKALEVFDANGNSIGSVPVYSNGAFS